MKKIIFAIVVLFFSANLFAQKDKSKKEIRRENRRDKIAAMVKLEEEGVIVNKKHFVSGVKLTNDGFGGFIEKGIAQSVKRALLFQLELTERLHPKEEKQVTSKGSLFKYGKTNFMYPLKLGVQQQILLGNKGNRNGVSVTANFGGGLSLALLRPYLLGFDSTVNNTLVTEYIKYEQNNSKFLSGTNSFGPGFGKGFNMIKVNPGLYAKSALRFDYAPYNEIISAIEVGVTGEFYSKKIQIMALNENSNFFLGAYFSLIFGRRK